MTDIPAPIATQLPTRAKASLVPVTGHVRAVFVPAIRIIMETIVPYCVAEAAPIKTENVHATPSFVWQLNPVSTMKRAQRGRVILLCTVPFHPPDGATRAACGL